MKSALGVRRIFRILHDQGKPPVRSQAWSYSRLARRGNTLFVLLPRVSRRGVTVIAFRAPREWCA